MGDYEILHLKPGASLEEIQQAYRDLVRVWHPDRFSADPRLQKIADEKLKDINKAYLRLENAVQETPSQTVSDGLGATAKRPDEFRPRTFYSSPIPGKMVGFYLLFTLTLIALSTLTYTFLRAPISELQYISADARRIAASNGPSVADAFEGWNGVLPQGLERLAALYQSQPVTARRDVSVSRSTVTPASRVTAAVRSESAPAFLSGVGEICLRNRSGEEIFVDLKSTRVRATMRGIVVPSEGEVTLGDLGPDLYLVNVTFPHSQRRPLRLGPFAMLEVESTTAITGDRYEIILKP